MKKIQFFIILFLILNINLNANTKIDLFTGKEVPITSSVNQSYTVTLQPQEIKLAEAKSTFNADTGEIKIDAQVIEDLNKMLKTFGSDAQTAVKRIVQEMATQAGIELSLEMLARLHYMIVNNLGMNEGILVALKTSEVANCFSTGFFNSLESEVEGGVGMSIYDLLSGKVGINFVSIAGIYPCVKKALGEPKDAEAKKRLNQSRQWVRFLFYKLLTQSFDDLFNMQLSAGEMDPKCRELKTQISKNNFNVSIAQFGKIKSPTGSTINSQITVSEPTKVGERIPDPKESNAKDIAKEDTDKAAGTPTETEQKINEANAKEEQIDNDNSLSEEEKTKEKKAAELKKAATRKYIEEVPISSTIVVEKNLDIIDVTDLKITEIIPFNNSIYDKIVYILKRQNTPYDKNIEGSFFKILNKLLTITTDNEEMKEKQKKLFEAKDKTASPATYIYKASTPKEKVLETEFYGKLRKMALEYNNQKYGLLSETEKEKIRLNVMQKIPNTSVPVKDIIAMGYYKQIIKKMNKWEENKKYIASGEPIFTEGGEEVPITDVSEIDDIIYNEYQYDLIKFRGQGAGVPDQSITKRINENIILKKPLHELEYLRLLYEAESRDVLLQIIGAQHGEQLGYLTISNKAEDVEKTNESVINYTIPKIRIIKQMYAIALLDLYSKRAESVNYWAMHYFQTTNTINESMKKFIETEIEKFKYKLKQKRLMIKLMLEKDVK